MACGNSSAYSASAYNWVEQFHSFPHINSKLKTVSSEFAPENRTYLEGAAFTGGLCVLAGLVLLLCLLVFLCLCWCKNRKRGEYERYKSRPGCHWTWAMVFALLCCAGLGCGYFGNEYVKEGVDNAVKAIRNGNQTVNEGQQKVADIVDQLRASEATLDDLAGAWQDKGLPPQTVNELLQKTMDAQETVGTARERASSIYNTITNVVDGAKYADDMKKYDDYRWKGTLGALCAIVGILIIMVIGVCMVSTCTLKFTAFLLVFALLVAWLTAGIFVALAVMGADFCVSPNDFVDRELQGRSYEDTVKYFVYCHNCPNPFQADYDTVNHNLGIIQGQLGSLKAQAQSYEQLSQAVEDITNLQVSLAAVENNLESLWQNQVNCTHLNRDYNNVIDAACDKIVDGAVFTFFAGCAIGLGVFFLLLALQRHWTRIASADDWYEGEGAHLIESSSSGRRRHTRRDGPQTRAQIQQFRADIDASRKEGYGSTRKTSELKETDAVVRTDGIKFPGEPQEAWVDESSKF